MKRILSFIVLYALLHAGNALAQCTPTISSASGNTLCSGQSTTLTAAGAASYTWYPGVINASVAPITPLQSGIYTVIATSGTCTSSTTIALTVFNGPTLAITASTNQVCAGSPVTLTVSGAQSYTWQIGVSVAQQNQSVVTASPMFPTQYSVSGTNSLGCTSSTTQVISTMSIPNASLSAANNSSLVCLGNTATLLATAFGPINYSWSTGSSSNIIYVTPTLNTVYTCTITNANSGCFSVRSLTVSVYTTTYTVTGPTVVCSGATAVFSASGATSYTWSTGTTSYSTYISPSVNTTYTVAGYSNNCISTQTINVAVLPSPIVTASVSNLVICSSEESVLTAGGALFYSWSNGIASPSITFTPGQNGYPTTTTTFTVTGTGANNCQGIAIVTQYVSACTGLEGFSKSEALFQVYPNPCNGKVTLLMEQDLTIRILNRLGQVVMSPGFLQAGRHELHLETLDKGLYILVAEGKGMKITKKQLISR